MLKVESVQRVINNELKRFLLDLKHGQTRRFIEDDGLARTPFHCVRAAQHLEIEREHHVHFNTNERVDSINSYRPQRVKRLRLRAMNEGASDHWFEG